MLNWTILNQRIKSSKRIVLSTHQNPDGDGLGSAVAMFHYISTLGIDCKILHISEFPNGLGFLNKKEIIETYNEANHDSWLCEADLALIFDVGDYKRLGAVGQKIDENNIYAVNIDHHPDLKNASFNESYINLNAAATGEMIYDFFTKNEISINKEIAEGIYTAVMTDTGSFRHSNTNELSHKIAMDCISNGVNNSEIYQSIYENRTQAQVSLLAMVIKNLKFHRDGEIASFVINSDMLSESGATVQDIDGFTDFVRSIKGVEIAIMVFEQASNKCRLNFRSKGKYIINEVAKHFGGGGHKFAAGAVASGVSKTVLEEVLVETKKQIVSQSMAIK